MIINGVIGKIEIRDANGRLVAEAVFKKLPDFDARIERVSEIVGESRSD